MKRTLSLLLTLLMLLSLAACGGDAAQDDPPAPPAQEQDDPTPEPDPEPQLTPEEQTVAALLGAMTVEEKVGQLFFVRCPESGAAADAASYHLGGILLFGRDFKDKTKDEVTANIAAYQAAADLPLFIGVDEEGGTVCRVSNQKQFRASRFTAPQKLYRSGGVEAVLVEDAERNALLRSFGINVNFAPVADVSENESDFIHDRSLGVDAATTAEVVAAMVGQMKADGMGSVLKHFPGYGSNVDTHTGIAVDERSLESFYQSDFLPFVSGIAAGSPFVLVSHNIMTAVDASLPASLSPAVHDILRHELEFPGVILTDDLAMDAVEAYAEDGSAAVLAVLAGNDMLVTTDYRTQIPQVIEAVNSGSISQETLDAAVTRILQVKLQLGLITTD